MDLTTAVAAAPDGVPASHRPAATTASGGVSAYPPGMMTQMMQEFGLLTQPAGQGVSIVESFPDETEQHPFDFQQQGLQSMIPETQVCVERVFLRRPFVDGVFTHLLVHYHLNCRRT